MERFAAPFDPQARRTLTFGFFKDLKPTDTIVSASMSVSLVSGDDPSPAELLVGAPAIVGPDVLHFAAGRADRNAYVIKCLATTAAGEVLTLSAVITMREGA